MKSNYRFPPLVKNIFKDVDEKGGSVFLVGGIVRDMLVYGNVDYHDVDIEVYGLTVEQLENILSNYGHVNCIGKSFGILKLDIYQIMILHFLELRLRLENIIRILRLKLIKILILRKLLQDVI